MRFQKKNPKSSSDVTVGTKKIKLYVQIECQLGYIVMAYADMRENMPR